MNKVLEVYGQRTCGGYDIGCSFLSTILRSTLGPRFLELESRMCVDAFHGYSHNYACQSVHHPNIIRGAGLEDFAGMERIFSASNALASVTRYASQYLRRVFIDMFCDQWDKEKYANLGTMLLNNYTQAVDILAEEPALNALLDSMKNGAGNRPNLEEWEKEEATYVGSLGKEDPYNVHHMVYVEALRELRETK